MKEHVFGSDGHKEMLESAMFLRRINENQNKNQSYDKVNASE